MVKENDRTLRMCIDFRYLNNNKVMNRYPIPRIDELMDDLHGSKFFSAIDLRSGYHQIRMREEDIAKTAFRCNYGHFEFVVIPFGLKNEPATFQSCMKNIFHKQLRKFVLVFFDGILIYSKTWKEHLHHIEEGIKNLHDQYLFSKLSKYKFRLTELLHIGYIIGQYGVKVDMEKIRAILEWLRPKSLTKLRGFIGISTYYRKFVKGFSKLNSPLTDLTKKYAFQWHEGAKKYFQGMKEVISNYVILSFPDFSKPFVLECDAFALMIFLNHLSWNLMHQEKALEQSYNKDNTQ